MKTTHEVRDGMSVSYLTTDRLVALRNEAALANNFALMNLCNEAILGSRVALRECARIVAREVSRLIAPTRDECFASDSLYAEDRDEVCDRCGAHVKPNQGSAVVLPDSDDEAWWCFECCDGHESDDSPGVEYEPEDDMDGDHGSALASVYGEDESYLDDAAEEE